jgi:hypothetical protein
VLAVAQAVWCRLHADTRRGYMSNLHSVAVTCVPRRQFSSLAALHSEDGLSSMLDEYAVYDQADCCYAAGGP